MAEKEKTSLSKYLGVCGVASRRKSCELIKQGKVLVNRRTVMEPGFKISPDDEIVCNGKEVLFQEKIYIMLNKPRGFVCTADDPHAPQKAVDLIKLPPKHSDVRIFSAGRLDKDSEGLLIFTNDGDYAEKIMHPRYEILKTYEVKTAAEIPDEVLARLRGGITDDGEFLHPEEIIRKGKCQYTFILNEGKKREIRRLVSFAGTKVTSLKRVALGKLKLGNLKSGQWKYLSPEEVL
ncbi:MAG: pseudouridine synthase [Victivallaceae bacterium]|nr:pseudouridine synthase [Victivallaceae bacterium]